MFVNKLMKKTCKILPTPCSSKRRIRAAPPDAPPRRNRRLAGVRADVSVEPNPTRIKKRVMRALDFVGEHERIDQNALDNYTKTFRQMLPAEHLKALTALFGWTPPEMEP